MLTDKDIVTLNNRLLDDRLFFEVEQYFVSTKSATIRDSFNSGDFLTPKEMNQLPYSESLAVKRIKDKNDIQQLTAYAITNRRDSQPLFKTNKFEYLTLFIENKNVSSQFKEWLIAHDLIYAFQSN